MNHGKAIYSILNGNSSIDSIVDGRIYQIRVPQKAIFPCITYQTISNVPQNSKSGFKIYISRVQIDVFSATYKGCVELSSLIKDTLADLPYGTYGGVVIHASKLTNQTDQSEDFADGDGLFHFILEFFITYNG